MKDKVGKIKYLLTEVLKNLNQIKSSNFEEIFPKIKSLLDESQKYKKFLLSNYSKNELKIFEPDLTKLAKQIKESFDNIAKAKKLEMAKIAEQIQYTQNKKKLIYYNR